MHTVIGVSTAVAYWLIWNATRPPVVEISNDFIVSISARTPIIMDIAVYSAADSINITRIRLYELRIGLVFVARMIRNAISAVALKVVTLARNSETVAGNGLPLLLVVTTMFHKVVPDIECENGIRSDS